MSASQSPPFQLSDVLSALNAKIERRRCKGQGPPLEGLAAKPLDYLVENLEQPWPQGAYEVLKFKQKYLDGDLDDLEGRTFTGPDLGYLFDPMADTPMGATGTVPLRIVAHNPQFPPNFDSERPRLIDVRSPGGFQSTTDCTNLRVMDAILTILHHDSPQLLKVIWAKPDLSDTTLEYNRYAGREELFDLYIECYIGSIKAELFQKVVNEEGALERKEEAYIMGFYRFGPEGHAIEIRHDIWMSPRVSGDRWDDDVLRKSSETPEVDEDRGRRLARYLLLMKPWEEKPGVRVKRTVRRRWSERTRMEESELLPRDGKEKIDVDKYSVVDPEIPRPEELEDWGFQDNEEGELVWQKKS